MYIHVTAPLFAWDALEDSPSLSTLRQFLSAVPDGRLLESLRAARGHGGPITRCTCCGACCC